MEERGKFIAPARNPHGHAIGLCHEMLLPSPEPDQSEYRQALGLALKRDRFQGVEFEPFARQTTCRRAYEGLADP